MASASDSATEPSLYSNLKLHNRQIRLLEITSTQPEIVCRLKIASLENKLAFSAISYVWGDPKKTKKIIVNGEKIAITTNLAHALEYIPGHLQRSKAPSRLWVDAICINQDDAREKNHQVPLMKDIFSMADTVLCWLGPPDEIMCRAIDIIELVAHERGERGGDGRDDELQHIFIDLAENIQVKAKSFDYILACGKAPPNVQESLQTHHVLGETEAHDLAHSLQSATEIISQSLDTPSRIKPMQYVGARHTFEAFNIAHSCLIKFGLLVSHPDAEDGQHVLESLTGATETLHKKLQDLVQSIASSRKSANSDWIHEHALIYDKSKSALNDGRTGLGAVCRFFCVPFWERVWIMQEIVLAHNPMFICGTRTLSLATLDSFAAWMESLVEGPDDIPCEYLKGTDSMFELVFTSNYKFLRLLFQARRDIGRPPGSCLRGRNPEVMGGMSRRGIWWAVHYLKATNPKDYFYGLLGIGGIDLDPDYSESKSVGAVCRDFMVEYLKLYQLRFPSVNGGALALLTFAGIGHGWHMYPDTPSWAPNFPGMANSDPDTGMIPGTWNRLQCDFLFQTSETARIVGSDMFVAGVILGSFQNVMPIPTGSMKQGASSELITWAVDRAMSRPTYVAGCHVLKALDAILRAKWHENFRGPVDRSLNDCSELLLFLRDSFGTDELQGLSDDDLAAFERRATYIKSLSKDIKDQHRMNIADYSFGPFEERGWATGVWRAAETDHGYIGVFPKHICMGDQLCIMKGLECPVILRNMGDCFAFVGVCIVIGLMDEEGVRALVESRGLEVETIKLR